MRSISIHTPRPPSVGVRENARALLADVEAVHTEHAEEEDKQEKAREDALFAVEARAAPIA